MLSQDQEVQTVLNGLIEVCKDSAECFSRAASSTHSAQLRQLYREFGRQRGEMVAQMQAAVRRLGGNPLQATAASLGGQHLIDLNGGPVAPASARELSEDCIRWERQALGAYEDALCGPLPPSLHKSAALQHEAIRTTLATLESVALQER